MKINRCLILIGVWLAMASFAVAKDDVQSVTWSAHSDHLDCHMNMGPTGTRVWLRGYQLQVMIVDAGSPAHGVLERGDLILAAAGTKFGEDADPRMTVGNAIGAAEADDGVLKLKIMRAGKKRTVKIQLPVMGPFSDTWPYDCRKSHRILHEACDYLSNAQFPAGELPSDGGMGTFTAGLLFLASGDERYMDEARRAAHFTAATDFDKIDYANWPKGYGGLLLAEYYLATGDATVLDKLKWVADSLAKGQMRCGSWGHNSPGGGYGAMNQAGVIDTMVLVLAEECGLKVDRVALNKALAFFGKYAELGAVPYGDHTPGTSRPDDNGKSASSAVLFSFMDDRQAEVFAFSESVAMSAPSRETGHTGGFFSMVWGPLGCAPVGKEDLHTFMDQQAWYYNFCRTWKGALVMLPYKEALTRFDSSSYNWFGGEYTTAGMALAFALPLKTLRILGAPRSVFGADKVSAAVHNARELYQKRDWDAFDAAVAMREGKDPVEKRYISQLRAARKMMLADRERTMKEVGIYLAENDAYQASEQYLALKRCLGDNDEALNALGEKLKGGQPEWYIREGKQYYEGFRNARVSAFKSWVPYYGKTSKLLLWDSPKMRPDLWEDLAPTAETQTNVWQVTRIAADAELPRDWADTGFDDTAWVACKGLTGSPVDGAKKQAQGSRVLARRTFDCEDNSFRAVRVRLRSGRNAITDVYLNGKQVAHVTRGQRGGYARIELDESALALVKKGKNLIAVTSTEMGSGQNALDVGVQVVVAEAPWEQPLRTGSLAAGPQDGTAILAPLPSLPEKHRNARDDTLKIREPLDRHWANERAVYDGLPVTMLVQELKQPVAYRRHLAEQALVRKGPAGLKAVVPLLQDDSYCARSSACNVVGLLWSAHEDKADAVAEAMRKQVPVIIELLKDKHFWVRYRAAGALSRFGKEAKAAVPALVRLASDEEQWVRQAALGAMGRVTDEPAPALAAARVALMTYSSSFASTRGAIGLIQSRGARDKASVPALIEVIENPGEGMGAQVLGQVMETLVSLDEKKSVPVLAKVAVGGYVYNRLRGNPRQKAMDLLAAMGARAMKAVPELKKIIASEDEADKKYQEGAQKAIDAIERRGQQ